MAVPEPLIDANELARRLGVSHWWVRRATYKDRIPFRHVGRNVRFDYEAVLAALDAEEAQPASRSQKSQSKRKTG